MCRLFQTTTVFTPLCLILPPSSSSRCNRSPPSTFLFPERFFRYSFNLWLRSSSVVWQCPLLRLLGDVVVISSECLSKPIPFSSSHLTMYFRTRLFASKQEMGIKLNRKSKNNMHICEVNGLWLLYVMFLFFIFLCLSLYGK